jgi:hypothetical protein
MAALCGPRFAGDAVSAIRHAIYGRRHTHSASLPSASPQWPASCHSGGSARAPRFTSAPTSDHFIRFISFIRKQYQP